MRSFSIKIHIIVFQKKINKRMSDHPLKKKSSLIMLGLLMAGANAGYLRNNNNAAYSDPYCNTFSPDGLCCIKCSYHYYMNSNGQCTAVSDWCKTWDDKTGACTSCFAGYGDPVNGVCSSTPIDNGTVSGGNDDHCAQYGYVDSKNIHYTSYVNGCKKVCT